MYNSDVSCMEYTKRFKVKLNILLGSNFAGFFLFRLFGIVDFLFQHKNI